MLVDQNSEKGQSESLDEIKNDSPIASSSSKEKDMIADVQLEGVHDADSSSIMEYRLYKRRFAGIVALFFLNIVAAMSWPWFGPISTSMTQEFGISLDQVNWLGNIIACIYLPTAIAIPVIISKFGIRRCCDLGAIMLVLSAWIRFAGTAKSLSTNSAYALLILGQFFVSIAQPVYQIIGPIYSETWFDLKGRTTATMIIAIANPLGGAIGQLISPLIGNTRQSILVLGIISTAAAPLVFLIGRAPPTPPTYAGSKEAPSLQSLGRAMLGMKVAPDQYMTIRERLDFTIITLIFGVLVAASNAFAILSGQIFVGFLLMEFFGPVLTQPQLQQPQGYSADEAGFFGACLLLTGILAAIVTAPLFDRVFTNHLAITAKVLVPFVALGWLSLIWAVRPNNLPAIFVVMTIIGVCSVPMLPVALELCCEITRNADGSSAVLWFAGNLLGIVFILAGGALRAGVDGSPPLNMHKTLIMTGTFAVVICSSVFFLHGEQKRKQMDKEKLERSIQAVQHTTQPEA